MNFSLRPCACLPSGAELPAGWSLPQCAVHPTGGIDDSSVNGPQPGAAQRKPYPERFWPQGCPCAACVPADADPLSFVAQMHLCPSCGNKRCPGAVNHDNACSGSNKSGQPGSFYEDTGSLSVFPEEKLGDGAT